jgi:hypothetical protein
MQRLSRIFEKARGVRRTTQCGGRIYCQYVFAVHAQCPINIDELIACAAGEHVVRWAHVSRPSRDEVESRVWLS